MLPWEVPWDVIASFQGMFVWMQGLDKVGVPEEYKADLLATGRPHAACTDALPLHQSATRTTAGISGRPQPACMGQ